MTRDALLFRLYTGLILLIALAAIFAPLLTSYDPYESQIQMSLLQPSAEHYFGTDKLGRDLFTRVLYGARVSLTMTLFVVVLIAGLGTLIGVISAYVGGKVDTVIMRLADIFLAFPGIVLAIAIAGVLGGSAVNAVLAIVVVGWTKYARLARSLTLKVKQQDYLAAAITNGTRQADMIRRHILPNILPIIIVTAALDIGALMMELAGLSFLGFGAQPPTPEWGLMLNEGRQLIQTAPWLMIFPGLAIVIVVAVFNLWGDSLRDIMDPRKVN
ncbi:dipeptide ABC superfamily ATP binding cassette transporter, permease protein [Centipeda periodontii DSM 2778]|uniref:Dipeptide ABC superfamily ATP binding cassette transporter, permease protein n=1 Tax=Centipeda periodontii DSM 2778 TaxID=888060 RepID=F5RMA8_9FIRM|nr:nickel transporter permease [Centipeda periodontii]EGK59799.1 dipeptide ABC superfamily ATP binding cassette transporter, permease protein [Centipeda periodontii DSM 2778]